MLPNQLLFKMQFRILTPLLVKFFLSNTIKENDFSNLNVAIIGTDQETVTHLEKSANKQNL